MEKLLRHIFSFAGEYDMLPEGSLILCAVSGGADSICLLHILSSEAKSRGYSVAAAHFNHRLRGAEADTDEEFVRAFCAQRGIPFYSGSGDVAGESRRRRAGLEETARRLRYAFLDETARELGAARIATAHTADDNAETLLMHLLRGSGLSGLSGIPPVRGSIVRPLLRTTRREILDYLEQHGLPHREDSSNADTRFTRNWVRHTVLPLLRGKNPAVTEALSRTAELLRADDRCLYRMAEAALSSVRMESGQLSLPAKALALLPDPVASRAVLLLLERTGRGRGDITAAHVAAVLELARTKGPSASLSLPRGVILRRVYSELVFCPEPSEPQTFSPTALNRSGLTSLMDGKWEIFCAPADKNQEYCNSPDTFYIKCDMIKESLLLRPRQSGDRIALIGRQGSRSLKRLMIDAKIPLWERGSLPVLADGGQVAAAAGFGVDRRYRALTGEEALLIKIKGDIRHG